MKLLLDTHTTIWGLLAPETLSEGIRLLITGAENTVYVSTVSIWEVAIKHALRKPGSPPFSGAEFLRHVRQSGFRLLNITPEHAAAIDALPSLHRDPFDRLLVAQALTEPLRLVTHDRKLAAYSDTIIAF